MRASVVSFVFVLSLFVVSAVPFVSADEGGVDPRIGEPTRIGEEESVYVVLDSSNSGSSEHAVYRPDATFIKVHFSEVDLADGTTFTVQNKDASVVYTFPGSPSTTDERPGFWALTVFGDTAIIKLHDASSGTTDSRIVIDRFIRGYADWELPGGQLESTCGTLERVDVACYEATHPLEFDTSHAVAMHVNNGVHWCTAWRVGAGPHMMTNEHCITSQAELDQAEFWFNYQRPDCGSGTAGPVTVTAGDTLLLDNETLDFSLLTIADPAAVSSFGYLELDPRTPVLYEEIYIPQHGSGNPKQFGIDSDMDPTGLCQIQDAIRNGYGTNTDTGYWCDTIGGSSGSPVLARSSNRVVAIHHWGTSQSCSASAMNSGVRMDMIWPLVSTHLVVVFIDGFESGNTTSWSRTEP